jgi:Holliday junction resolvasome RuvABC DNA-binding subunit
MSLEKLKKLKTVLEAKQQERAKVEGQLESALDRLKELGYKSVAEADKAIHKMDTQLDALDADIATKVRDLEEKYVALL